MNKNDLFHGFWIGLNKARFIPNDILTVKCEITLYETVEENYDNEDKFEDTTKHAKKGVFKCLQYYFGFMMFLFLLFWAIKGIFLATLMIIGFNAALGIEYFLPDALKKLWKRVKSNDEIYNKSRISTGNKVKTN